MKGTGTRLIEYMQGANKRFVIPVYQRNYDWKTENCKWLYDDLVKVNKNKRKSHFLGSIVSVYEPSEGNVELLIIDGQQRLTTVSLLFLAMYNLIKEGVIIPNDGMLGTRIYEEYLIDKYQPKETRIKLKSVKNDQQAFTKLFENEKDHILGSNLTVNYSYFYNRIQQKEITVDELYNAICCLQIIDIQLNSDDEPQLIFESLNSTGLDLTEGDKIRNFILMGLPSQLQSEYYEKYWNQIEECTKYDVSSFVRDYLSIKQSFIPSQKKIYFEFKDYVSQTALNTEDILAELLDYSKRYKILLNGNLNDKITDACINRLNRLETTVTRPFFLEVLRLYDEKKIDLSQVREIFVTTEIYLFRRVICDLPTNVLNKMFLMLHGEIIRYEKNEDNYVEKFKFALLSKKEKVRFPDDEEFSSVFSSREVFQMNRKNKLYILERIENFGTLEDKDIYGHCEDGTYTIEHIMPQTLSPVWKKELGDDYEHIHKTWLHRIANLTLTAYNSNYSNSPFNEKKSMKNGFNESGIRMNTYIAKFNKWTLSEIEQRNSLLKEKALQIWSMPVTKYKPQIIPLDTYTLDDEPALFTGRDIVKFSFINTEQMVRNWADVYIKVLQILYFDDKSIIERLAVSTDEGIAKQFSLNKFPFGQSTEIADGIYVSTNCNTPRKLSFLTKIFYQYDIDPSDLVFYLKNSNPVGETDELRVKYWSYLIDFIQKNHDKYYVLSEYVRPLKHNSLHVLDWIYCTANLDSARVDLVFAYGEKEINKKVFDYLKRHSDEIEDCLGAKLLWQRGENIKSSKISYVLNDVSVTNKLDWEKMVVFHAEWSKKFLDVIVPYLNNITD